MAPTSTESRGWDSVRGRKAKKRAPKGALKEYTEAYRHETTLLGDVQAYLLSESLKEDPDRRRDVIHPSEMAKPEWCDRQTFYRISGVEETNPKVDKASFFLEAIFEEGHNIHTKWQGWLWNMGRLWGLWGCTHCFKEWYGDSPQKCPFCETGKNGLVYKEVPLTDGSEHGINGHADGAIPDINALIEIKSVGLGTLRLENPGLMADYYVETADGGKVYDLDALWRNLASPFPSHLRQGNIYLHLCKLMDLPYDKIVFLYEFKATQAVKEFTVKLSDTIMDPLLDRVANVDYSLRVGVPPQRPPFTGEDKKICTSCPWNKHCYQSKEPRDYKRGSKAANDRLGSGEGLREASGAGIITGAAAKGTTTDSTGRPHGVYRQGSNDLVIAPDELVVVGRTGSSPSGGRREVRRRPLRESEG